MMLLPKHPRNWKIGNSQDEHIMEQYNVACASSKHFSDPYGFDPQMNLLEQNNNKQCKDCRVCVIGSCKS